MVAIVVGEGGGQTASAKATEGSSLEASRQRRVGSRDLQLC